MAAPAFAAAGTHLTGASGTTANFPVPSGVAANNVILVGLHLQGAATITPPAGFVEAAGSPVDSSPLQWRMYWKRASGSDTGTYDFGLSASVYRLGFACRYTGCITTITPIEVVNNGSNTGSTSYPNTSLTTSGTDRLLVWTATNYDGTSTTAPSGFTKDAEGTTNGSNSGSVFASKTQAAAGASGTLSATVPSGTGAKAVWLGALIPVGGSAAGGAFFSFFNVAPGTGGAVELGAGQRAALGTVGYLGNSGSLTVLNPADSLPGGWSAGWDGTALIIGADNVTIDHYRINGCVVFTGENPTMTNCEIHPTSGDIFGVTLAGASNGVLTVVDTTVVGSNTNPGQANAISSDGGLNAIRCDVHGTNDGIHLVAQPDVNDAVISQCCIHDLSYLDEEQHLDGIQTFSHETLPGFLKVEHCYVGRSIMIEGEVPMSAGIFITSTTLSTPVITPTVNNNHIESGAFHLRLLGLLQDMTITNNDFGPLYPNEFGLVDYDPDPDITTWSNNRDSDDELIPSPASGGGLPLDSDEITYGAAIETISGHDHTYSAAAVSQLAEALHVIDLRFYGASDIWPIADHPPYQAEGQIPMVTWEPFGATLDDITAGDFDTYLTNRANDCEALGYPILFRPMHEMNGNWYPWSGAQNGANLAANTKYINAWRHIHALFQTAGATNVFFVWCPNNNPVPGDSWNATVNYYPGDAYLDYIGVDGYNFGTGDVQLSPSTIFGGFYSTFSSYAKPMIICETSSADNVLGEDQDPPAWTNMDKPQWIEDLDTWLGTAPLVKGVIWFNFDKEQAWQIDSSSGVLTAFQAMIADWVKLPEQTYSTPKINTLVENFAASSPYFSYGNGGSVSSGSAHVTCSASPTFNFLPTVSDYDFTATSFYFKWTPSSGGTGPISQVIIDNGVTGGTDICLSYESGSLKIGYRTGYTLQSPQTVSFTPGNYLRMTESGGSITIATSSDASSWTTLGTSFTYAAVGSIASCELRFMAWNTSGSSSDALIDNINTTS